MRARCAPVSASFRRSGPWPRTAARRSNGASWAERQFGQPTVGRAPSGPAALRVTPLPTPSRRDGTHGDWDSRATCTLPLPPRMSGRRRRRSARANLWGGRCVIPSAAVAAVAAHTGGAMAGSTEGHGWPPITARRRSSSADCVHDFSAGSLSRRRRHRVRRSNLLAGTALCPWGKRAGHDRRVLGRALRRSSSGPGESSQPGYQQDAQREVSLAGVVGFRARRRGSQVGHGSSATPSCVAGTAQSTERIEPATPHAPPMRIHGC